MDVTRSAAPLLPWSCSEAEKALWNQVELLRTALVKAHRPASHAEWRPYWERFQALEAAVRQDFPAIRKAHNRERLDYLVAETEAKIAAARAELAPFLQPASDP